MIVDSARLVLLVLGTVIAALSVWGIYTPRRLVQMVSGVVEADSGIYIAVLTRLVLGASLVLVASTSRFPNAFEIVGWMTLVAAAVLFLVGRGRLRKIVTWFDRFSPALVRMVLVIGIAFGAVLVYGVNWSG